MIPFPFNGNKFSFFVADHLLVGQLCTNPKSDRNLVSCLKVTQCSTSEIGDAPLYNFCSLPIQVMTTRPLPAPSKCKSGLPRITGTCPGWWKQSFQLQLWSLVWFEVRATSCHLKSSKSAWKSTPKCTWIGWRVWWSPGAIRCLVADRGHGNRPQWRLTSPKRLRLGFRRSATTLYTFLTGPHSSSDLNPLDYFVWSYVENITNMTSHNTWSPSSTEYSPSSRRRLWKRHDSVPDPYRGGDWGWKRLHWIDVSSTT